MTSTQAVPALADDDASETVRYLTGGVLLRVNRVNQRLEQLVTLMGRISEQQLLSDRARSVAFRDKDREAIRTAINEELLQGEWEAAFALADQFEQAAGRIALVVHSEFFSHGSYR